MQLVFVFTQLTVALVLVFTQLTAAYARTRLIQEAEALIVAAMAELRTVHDDLRTLQPKLSELRRCKTAPSAVIQKASEKIKELEEKKARYGHLARRWKCVLVNITLLRNEGGWLFRYIIHTHKQNYRGMCVCMCAYYAWP